MPIRIALVTCAKLPHLDADDRLLLEPFRVAGVEAEPAIWDDPAVDWATFDLAVIRSTWDYPARRADFVAWARSVPRLANPADVVGWNTDKRYLAHLEAAGLPVVPTSWMEDASEVLPARGSVVIKPAVGAGSVHAARYEMDREHEAQLAHEHARRLIHAGHTVMVQPYVQAIESNGETGVIFVGGEFSHAMRKGPMLASPGALGAEGLFMAESITSRAPTSTELDVARRALAVVPGGPERVLYARVDLVSDSQGKPMIMELELTEPSLFMRTAPGSADRFARAIVSYAEQWTPGKERGRARAPAHQARPQQESDLS